MLISMLSQTAHASPATTGSNFARLFAGLMTPKRPSEDPDPASGPEESWLDALGDDVKTISYEQALRTHARYRQPAPLPELDPAPDLPRAKPTEQVKVSKRITEDRVPLLAPKSSSITLRLTGPESAQVHARAADAGMTMSAYLRSCIFEVETLRSQVKDVLAQLHTEPAPETVPAIRSREERNSTPAKDWRSRLFALLGLFAPRSRYRVHAGA